MHGDAAAAIDQARDTAAELHKRLGERLRVALLYGSVARGEYVDGVSDINVIAMLDDVDTDALLAAAPHSRRMEQRNINLLVLEWADRSRLADTFCMELLDLADACIPLIGENPFGGVAVDPGMLRAQAERESRTRLLHLHAGMLHALSDRRQLGSLLQEAVPSFTTVLRAALRLAKRAVPGTMAEVIRDGCARVGANADGLLAACEARTSRQRFELEPADPRVEAYRSACERIVNYIDTFEGGGVE